MFLEAYADWSKKKNVKIPSRGFSMYSSDSEDPVVTAHKGLDRCASLLAHIMESPSHEGARQNEGRSKQKETTGLKMKQKRKLKKRSCKEEKPKVKGQPKVDKKVAARGDKRSQPGCKKSKPVHHQVVFQPGLLSSTPQRGLYKEDKPQRGPDTKQSMQAQAVHQYLNQVRGQVPNTLGRVIQTGRYGSTGHYGDQIIPEKETNKESRHLQQELRDPNDLRQTENLKRFNVRDETEVVNERYQHNLNGRLSTMSGYHGFRNDYPTADAESSTTNEIGNLLNEPQGRRQNETRLRQCPHYESHDGQRIDNPSYSAMHESIPKKGTQHDIHGRGVDPQAYVQGISDGFIQTSMAPTDDNHVARNVLRDLVNTLKSINQREAASLAANPKVGNQILNAAGTMTDGETKEWMSKDDGQTLEKKEKTSEISRNVIGVRDQPPPVNTAQHKQQSLQALDRCPENFLRDGVDSDLRDDRIATSVENYPVCNEQEENREAVKDFGPEIELKEDSSPQEIKNEEARNAQISPETYISMENYAQVEDETLPGERGGAKSPEKKKKKKRKFQSVSVGPKSKTKRALWEQQRVLKCLVMELKAVTEKKENLEVQRLFGEILETLDTLPFLTMDCDIQTEIAMGLQPLRSENAQLRRRLRISNQQMKELQNAGQQQQSFEVIALKTLNNTLQGQLEAEQKDTAALREQVEVLNHEMETLSKKREELTQLLKLKDERHLTSQREWITEMASLRKQQTCSKQELETVKSTLDSLRKENMFLAKCLEESKRTVQELKGADRTRISPSRKRSWEFGGLENMPKVIREAERKTRFDMEDTIPSERMVDANNSYEGNCLDVSTSSHRRKTNVKILPSGHSLKKIPSWDETRKLSHLEKIRQYDQGRALEAEFARRKSLTAEEDENLSNWNLSSDSELEWQKNQDVTERMLSTAPLIPTCKTHTKVKSDDKQRSNEYRAEADNFNYVASLNTSPEKKGLHTALMVSDSESIGKMRISDASVVVDGEQTYLLPPSFGLNGTNKQRSSSSMPLGTSQDFSVPYQGESASSQGAVSPSKVAKLKPREVSKAIDEVSCVSESTASSITSLFEAQFQLGLSNLDDKIAKLQENLKYFKGNKNA